MKKDIEWLRNKLEYFHKLDRWNWEQCEPNSKEQSHFYGCLAAYEKALDFLNELDEPEVLSQDKKSEDLVNHPIHYQGLKGLEVREVMENFVPKYDQYGGLVSCDIKDAIKYILRAPDKNGLEDLQKAQRMIKYAIDSLEDDRV